MKTVFKKLPILLTITLAISCLINSGSSQNVAAQAKPKPTLSQLLLPKLSQGSNTTTNSKIKFNRPAIPPGTAPGGRRTGGGRRDSCTAVNPKLTALVPVTEVAPTIQHVWGFTTVERPTFWFYLPYTKSDSYPTEFVLQDQDSNPIYTTNVTLPEQPGIISIAIPRNVPALAIDRQYRWFLKVYCDTPFAQGSTYRAKQSPPIYVEGVVRRIKLNPNVAQQLSTARPQQQANIYAENGIWFQALATLAKLQKNNPRDAATQAAWKNLLIEVGLGDIADKPIRGSED
jgi:Domain of Unknown Function (DUF928)